MAELLSELKERVVFPNLLEKFFFVLVGNGQCLFGVHKFLLEGRQFFLLRGKYFTIKEPPIWSWGRRTQQKHQWGND